MTHSKGETQFPTALTAIAIVFGAPTISAASDFPGVGAAVIFLAFVGIVSSVLALITTVVLWKRTKRGWIWFLLPLIALLWAALIVAGFLAFADIRESFRPLQ